MFENKHNQIMELSKTLGIEIIVPKEKADKIKQEFLNTKTDSVVEGNFSEQVKLYGPLFSASQQFCFHVGDFRSKYTSGLINDNILKQNTVSDMYKISKILINEYAPTLRKERIEILNYIYESVSNRLSVSDILDSWVFQEDFFFKKGMFAIYLYKSLGVELMRDIKTLPCIDYQIPKLLEYYGIIKYPSYIKKMIELGEPIQKESYEEIMIRTIAYVGMVRLHEATGISYEELDWFLFSKRNSINTKYHKTITTHY